jgi:hypothetical protein
MANYVLLVKVGWGVSLVDLKGLHPLDQPCGCGKYFNVDKVNHGIIR